VIDVLFRKCDFRKNWECNLDSKLDRTIRFIIELSCGWIGTLISFNYFMHFKIAYKCRNIDFCVGTNYTI